MKVQRMVAVVALGVGVPALASAQGGATTRAQDPTTTSGAGSTAQPATTADGGMFDRAPSHWTASGFVGSDFGDEVDGNSVDFGGSIGYLWRGALGGEFLAGFAPNFKLADNILAGDEPQVNSYMANLIGAVPLGADAQWQPFVSGGFGAITLRSDLFGNVEDSEIANAFNPDDTQFGGNIGFGVMGYAGAVGVRADVRYFRGFDEGGTTDTNAIAQSILSNLDFWRANIGVAVRW
jgi:hypothetical protein